MRIIISESILDKCVGIKITPEIFDEVNKFSTDEELLRSGGISTIALDRAAFGFAPQDITTLMPNQLKIKWRIDMLNPPEKQKRSGLTPKQWAKTVDLSEPIEVSYEKGKFFIEDGHHRYYAAKILNTPLNVVIEIKDNPIIVLGNGLSYDDYHRCVFKKVKQ